LHGLAAGEASAWTTVGSPLVSAGGKAYPQV